MKLEIVHGSLFSLMLGASILAGCGSSRDVEVTGELATASGVASDAPILVQFYETSGDEEVLVHSMVVEQAGEFTEKVPFEGDELRVVAVLDRDEDEACTNGEPWAELSTEILEDDTAKVSLTLADRAECPAVPTSE